MENNHENESDTARFRQSRDRRKTSIWVGLTAAALCVGGVVSASFPDASAAPRESSSEVIAVANRKPATDFTLKDASGATVHLSKLHGKVVLLNFWATWCMPCKVEIPWFVDLQQRYRKPGLSAIGISMDDDGWKAVKPYLAENKINYQIVIGNDALAEKYGGVDALPTTVMIDRAGRIAALHAGLTEKKIYEQEIQDLLTEK